MMLKIICRLIKIGEMMLASEELLKKYYEHEKEEFPEITLEYVKQEIIDEVNRLKRYINTLRESNLLLKNLIDQIMNNINITEKDVENAIKDEKFALKTIKLEK